MWVLYSRRRARKVHVFCTGFFSHEHDFAGGGAPDYGVVDQEDILAGELVVHGIELAADALLTSFLAGHCVIEVSEGTCGKKRVTC